MDMHSTLSSHPHGGPSLSGLAAASKEKVFIMPCSAAQIRFWQIDQLSGKQGAVFNIQLALSLTGPLREDLLQHALEALVDRHEILRTSFDQIEGEVKQVIASHAQLRMSTIDLRQVPEAERPERLKREIQNEAERPLSLERKPIFRPMLVRLGQEENVLLLTTHHIVCDGWATGILVRELAVFYQALYDGTAPDLPPLPVQYADYALWQREWIKTPECTRQLGYWKKELSKDIPMLDFPTDFPRRSGQAFPSTIETLLLPRDLGEAVQRASREWDTTPYLIFFTAYLLLLQRYSSQERFIVGTVVANRPRVELEGVVGAFANPMILRADVSGEPTVRQLLHSTREMVLSSFDHQEVPFESILQELETTGGVQHKPTLQTFFFFQRAFLQPTEFGGVSMKPIRSVTPGTTFEQTLAIIERAEGMRLQIDYNTDLFTTPSIQRFLQGFQILLEGILANPDARVSELSMLTAEERKTFNFTWASMEPASRQSSGEVLMELETRFKQRVEGDTLPFRRSVNPPQGTRLLVLDPHLRATSPGVPGSIYLIGLDPAGDPARQYEWLEGTPEVPPHVPLLKTGYVGRTLVDGRVELWGKASDFVSFRGFRINLREIEAHLMSHPRVADAVAVKDEVLGRLACYAAMRGAGLKDEVELRAFLKERLSDLVPLAPIVIVPAIVRDELGQVRLDQLQVTPPSPVYTRRDDAGPDMILYQQLTEIWKEILKVPDIALDDNFFELGGSSFQAVRMMAQIERIFGERLPLSLLLKGATLSNLARALTSKRNEGDISAIQLVQPEGSRTPFFFLHGDWAGGGFYCNHLAKIIGNARPFYAISPYRHAEDDILSLDAMAAYHVAAIKDAVPHGPYVLGGYCIGATLAIEIARQLMARGDDVDHVILIDPALKRVPWLRHAWRVVDRVGRVLRWDLKQRMSYYDRYPVALDRWLNVSWPEKQKLIRHRFLTRDANGAGPGEPGMEILNTVEYGAYALASQHSLPRELSVPATFYYPLAPAAAQAHAALSRLDSEKITIEQLPGNHVTCITKYVSVLAEKLKIRLDHV